MDRNDMWSAIDAQRARVADLLEQLSGAEWKHPSLCENWTVHDVAAHLTLAPYITIGATLKAVLKARGSFNRMVYATAKEQAAARAPGELIAMIRNAIGSRRLAPGQHLADALMDVHVHTQDIAIPLGRHHPMPTEVAIASADHLWGMGFPFHARKRLAGHRLVATDVDWSAGEGAEIAGPIEALVMLIAGRSATIPRLTGTGLTD
jgi:uncharacterized protein (TIGR03083 family)